ncbi:MAG: acyltransferase family protein [Pseudomonadota bacterium]|nr:acyltransferase family protein [Pseudomonadota bacterium]
MNFNQKIAGKSYRADIDGLRAVAVLPVVFYHAGLGFPGGYVGVDIFFVISGYLITQIIFREINQGNFSFVDFYERRARRILPALFFMLVISSLGAWLLLLPEELSQYGKSILATLAFFANFFFSHSLGDYFASDAEFQILLHMWSLAVEEQFYIFFPFLLILSSRAGKSKLLTAFLVSSLVAILSLYLASVSLEHAPVAAFYHSPGRAWELGIGALLALGVHDVSLGKFQREIVSIIGTLFLAVAIFYYDKNTAFPGLAALAPCLGAACIIWAGRQGPNIASRILSFPPLVFVGLISYSLYLLHWPIMALLRNYTGFASLSERDAWASVTLSFLLAIFSWAVVERPFRSKRYINSKSVFVFSFGGGVIFSIFAAGVIAFGGVPSRFPAEVQSFAAGLTDRNPRRDDCFDQWPESGLCRIGDPARTPNFIFWGDSHADALMPGVDKAAVLSGHSGLFLAHGGCPPVLNIHNSDIFWAEKCQALYSRLSDALAVSSEKDGMAEISQVVLHARWSVAEKMVPLRRMDLPESASEYVGAELFNYGLGETIDLILTSGRTVVIIIGTPEFGWNVPSKLVNYARFGKPLPASPTLEKVSQMNADLLANLQKYDGDERVKVVSINDVLCADVCLAQIDGHPLYVDGNHLSAYAAEEVLARPLSERIWNAQ